MKVDRATVYVAIWDGMLYNQKSIASGRLLNYKSAHNINQKLNTAYGFVYRVHKLTSVVNPTTLSVIKTILSEND